jgi:hypothetical protein
MRLQNVASLLILAGGLYFAPKTAFGQNLDSGLNLDAGPTSVPKKLKSLDLSAIDKTAEPTSVTQLEGSVRSGERPHSWAFALEESLPLRSLDGVWN